MFLQLLKTTAYDAITNSIPSSPIFSLEFDRTIGKFNHSDDNNYFRNNKSNLQDQSIYLDFSNLIKFQLTLTIYRPRTKFTITY